MCRFCERFKSSLCVTKHLDFSVQYSVALVVHPIVDVELKCRTVHYMKDGVGFPLNYCPECGKKLLED